MISNMQQQNFDGVVNKMLTHETSGLCINNNNTNKNKNISTSPSGVMHNQDPNGFDFITPFPIHSSENAKEYVTSASHSHQEEGFASLLDEISELIECNPTGTESAFNQRSDSHAMGKDSKIVSQEQKLVTANESHRNAFRLVEDVHNYSKLNRSDESTNSSSQDDEEFEDEDSIDDERNVSKREEEYFKTNIIGENIVKIEVREHSPETPPKFPRVPEDDEEKTTPDHHARRPMNAFLIFCKRHRAIVREKYKHLENRSITKILGEWWASLSDDERACYTNLAKQYKDAFFSANPNFKWYKLPAPPLRTLSTRPTNIDRTLLNSNHNYSSTNNFETITSSNKDRNIRSNHHYRNDSDDEETLDASEMGVFKLADEAQMGGLNSLMKNFDTLNHKIDPIARLRTEQNILRHVKVEPTPYFTSYKEEPFEKMKEYYGKEGNNETINGKRKSTEDINLNGCKRQILFNDNNISSGEEDILGKKSERSCKGKKYQELKNSGQIITFTKKTKTKSDMMSHAFTHNGYMHHNDNYLLLSPGKIKLDDGVLKDHNKPSTTNAESPVKQFDASDFDLEEKIKALPAQSLEEYLNRKREIKKKKKINSRRHKPRQNSTKEPPKTFQEAKERMQSQMVGSQKRKARKESITRREITSMVLPNDGLNHIYESVELWSASSATLKSEDHSNKINNTTETTSDLLILAEVATNHIEDNA